MPQKLHKFCAKRLERLQGVHPALQDLCLYLLYYHDITVVRGRGTEEEQRALVEKGLSKTMNSLHLPQADGYAHAVDIAPFPIDWDNTKRFYMIYGMAEVLATKVFPENAYLRWGGNWDCDEDLDDQTFMDLVHFEIRFK